MPEKSIKEYLIIDWKDGSTKTRKTKPKASDLGTHELSTTLTLDVIIPEVDVDELRATVEVPKPRVKQTALDDVDADDAPDWMDVADESVDEHLASGLDSRRDWDERSSEIILDVIERAPTNPDVSDVRRYVWGQISDAKDGGKE